MQRVAILFKPAFFHISVTRELQAQTGTLLVIDNTRLLNSLPFGNISSSGTIESLDQWNWALYDISLHAIVCFFCCLTPLCWWVTRHICGVIFEALFLSHMKRFRAAAENVKRIWWRIRDEAEWTEVMLDACQMRAIQRGRGAKDPCPHLLKPYVQDEGYMCVTLTDYAAHHYGSGQYSYTLKQQDSEELGPASQLLFSWSGPVGPFFKKYLSSQFH